jgi:outer membrane receptor protein involved in Fe transport
MNPFLAALLLLNAVTGRVVDPDGRPVSGAQIEAGSHRAQSNAEGVFRIEVDPAACRPEGCELRATAPGLVAATAAVAPEPDAEVELRFTAVEQRHETVAVSAQAIEPGIDLHNGAAYDRTLFTRDDQLLRQMDAGIDAGQHEGGGKSLEIRRFGFNLDHGGANGGLKVMLDDVQQNQGTQGHGQGYLGALKTVTPELIQDVTVVNGPFRAEYGDFSGLGVVQIRQRESLPQLLTLRSEAGSFGTRREFLGWSPDLVATESYLAFERSASDGPFLHPLGYVRNNVNANFSRSLADGSKLGFRLIGGTNRFDSSGQLPLDLVTAGTLSRFGNIDPADGGRTWLGTASAHFDKPLVGGSLRADTFVTRSLFDLYSDFTFYRDDPVHGDGIQQHDSRLEQGENLRYSHAHRFFGATGNFESGAGLHDSHVNVALYRQQDRVPFEHVTSARPLLRNASGWAQETVSFWKDRLLLSGGLRYDLFHYPSRTAGIWQGKGSAVLRVSPGSHLSWHLNYGRGVNSLDARGVVAHPELAPVATTDFSQAGFAYARGRVTAAADAFLIDHSNELVYVPDDGSFEFHGPSRAYGWESKASFVVTRALSVDGGFTKTLNAFYRGGNNRIYVDSAPHFVAHAGITVSAFHNWTGSLRMSAINHYRLNGEDPSIAASGHTGFDFSASRQLRKALDVNLAVDNLTNRSYFETQNYFESRVAPDAAAQSRIHGTPGYPRTVVIGITLRLGEHRSK